MEAVPPSLGVSLSDMLPRLCLHQTQDPLYQGGPKNSICTIIVWRAGVCDWARSMSLSAHRPSGTRNPPLFGLTGFGLEILVPVSHVWCVQGIQRSLWGRCEHQGGGAVVVMGERGIMYVCVCSCVCACLRVCKRVQ